MKATKIFRQRKLATDRYTRMEKLHRAVDYHMYSLDTKVELDAISQVLFAQNSMVWTGRNAASAMQDLGFRVDEISNNFFKIYA